MGKNKHGGQHNGNGTPTVATPSTSDSPSASSSTNYSDKKPSAANSAAAKNTANNKLLFSFGAVVVVAFAAGFGGALQMGRHCRGIDPATPSLTYRLLCRATAMPPPPAAAAKPAAVTPTKAAMPNEGAGSPVKMAPAPGAVNIGPGGVGAPDGEDAWAYTTHPTMATAGWNWTQLGMSRTGNFPGNDIKHLTAAEVKERGAMWVWHTTFARSIPATVSGLASQYSDVIKDWSLNEYRKRWGQNTVVVAFSDHPNFNRGVPDHKYGRLVRHPDRQQRTFSEYLDMVDNPHPEEHIAVQQSPSRDFGEFGLPNLPPLLEELTQYTLNARNFCKPYRAA